MSLKYFGCLRDVLMASASSLFRNKRVTATPFRPSTCAIANPKEPPPRMTPLSPGPREFSGPCVGNSGGTPLEKTLALRISWQTRKVAAACSPRHWNLMTATPRRVRLMAQHAYSRINNSGAASLGAVSFMDSLRDSLAAHPVRFQ